MTQNRQNNYNPVFKNPAPISLKLTKHEIPEEEEQNPPKSISLAIEDIKSSRPHNYNKGALNTPNKENIKKVNEASNTHIIEDNLEKFVDNIPSNFIKVNTKNNLPPKVEEPYDYYQVKNSSSDKTIDNSFRLDEIGLTRKINNIQVQLNELQKVLDDSKEFILSFTPDQYSDYL